MAEENKISLEIKSNTNAKSRVAIKNREILNTEVAFEPLVLPKTSADIIKFPIEKLVTGGRNSCNKPPKLIVPTLTMKIGGYDQNEINNEKDTIATSYKGGIKSNALSTIRKDPVFNRYVIANQVNPTDKYISLGKKGQLLLFFSEEIVYNKKMNLEYTEWGPGEDHSIVYLQSFDIRILIGDVESTITLPTQKDLIDNINAILAVVYNDNDRAKTGGMMRAIIIVDQSTDQTDKDGWPGLDLNIESAMGYNQNNNVAILTIDLSGSMADNEDGNYWRSKIQKMATIKDRLYTKVLNALIKLSSSIADNYFFRLLFFYGKGNTYLVAGLYTLDRLKVLLRAFVGYASGESLSKAEQAAKNLIDEALFTDLKTFQHKTFLKSAVDLSIVEIQKLGEQYCKRVIVITDGIGSENEEINKELFLSNYFCKAALSGTVLLEFIVYNFYSENGETTTLKILEKISGMADKYCDQKLKVNVTIINHIEQLNFDNILQ